MLQSHNHSVCIRPGLPKYTVAPQTVSFQLKGSLSRISTLHKWSSRLAFNGSPSTYFSYDGEVQVIMLPTSLIGQYVYFS